MRLTTTLITFTLAACISGTAVAAPQAATPDEFEVLLADKGIVAQLDQVRKSVTVKASDLVFTAMGFLGVPYRRGGTTASTGFDCSGFVRAMYQQTVGLVLPRQASEQAAATQKIAKSELQPGDLVFFNTMRRAFSHVGIYVGDGKFIHSPRTGSEVRIDDIGNSYWSQHFDGARRVQGGAALPAGSANSTTIVGDAPAP